MGTGSERAMAAVVDAARRDELRSCDLAQLAATLARSGACRARSPGAVSAASTGGPSSLTTLLTPAYLAAMGRPAPTLGVPGRPAGGVDVLEVLPGYRTVLSLDEVDTALRDSNLVQVRAGVAWTPLDAQFFDYRQRHDAQALPSLVIASILAKKIAMGVTALGLDVRVAEHGNFGASTDEAQGNAVRFAAVARLVGIKATCLLTDANRPFQPFIGRGEALKAVHDVAYGVADDWLTEHDDVSFRLAAAVVESTNDSIVARPDPADLRAVIATNLSAQGSSLDALARHVADLDAQPSTTIIAEQAGIAHFKLRVIRDALVQSQRVHSDDPDPSGLTLLVRPGAPIERGQELARVRSRRSLDALVKALAPAIVETDPATYPRAWLPRFVDADIHMG